MEAENTLAKQKYIFGSLFLLSNKLQAIGDRMLGEFTTKQWFLTVMIAKFGEKPPTLNEVSELMGSSHQNVKQLALKLQEKGFLQIEKDERDNRAIRLKLTEKCRSYWEKRRTKDEQFISELFVDFADAEIDGFYHGLNKLNQKIIEKREAK